MDKLISMYIAAELWAKDQMNKFFRKEDGAVDIIAIVVLIAIAVVLAIVFRERIKELLDSIFDSASTNAESAVGKYS